MLKRHWDPQQQYTSGSLKEYAHWVLEVSYRQHTIGSFIIFAKRNIEKFSDASNEESMELKLIMKKIDFEYKIPFSLLVDYAKNEDWQGRSDSN